MAGMQQTARVERDWAVLLPVLDLKAGEIFKKSATAIYLNMSVLML